MERTVWTIESGRMDSVSQWRRRATRMVRWWRGEGRVNKEVSGSWMGE